MVRSVAQSLTHRGSPEEVDELQAQLIYLSSYTLGPAPHLIIQAANSARAIPRFGGQAVKEHQLHAFG
jgi:hypothetical protein